MKEILKLDHIQKFYGNEGNVTKAIQDIDFSVQEGEFLGIMGASGSGKTTLLNILASLDKPTNGEILLNGKNTVQIKDIELSAFRRDNLGFVFQDFNLLDTFSLKDNIFLPLVLTKMNIQNPNASGVLYNVFTLIGVLVGLWIYGIATRRAYLLWTFYVSAAILTVMILWTSMSPLVALIMITAFALVLAASIVPEFSYPAELFPTELRGSGVGLTIAISRFGAGGGTFLLPIVSEQFGIHMALWCCVITLLFGGIICLSLIHI